MKGGYRIIDADTHVGPNMETLQQFAGPRLRERWSELDQYMQPVTLGGHQLSIEPIRYKRRMGESDSGEFAVKGGVSPLKGSVSKDMQEPAADEVNNLNSAGRLQDMDREGVDVHLIIPATFALAVSALDVEMALEIYAAYHRFIAAYCEADPSRLKGTLLVSGADPKQGADEVRRLADERWLSAVTVVLPEGLPIDDPSLHPLWEAMDEHDLPILHHSFFYEPPYFPGARDVWGNVVVARAAAHVWGAERLVAYLTLSGLLDQYPNLRIGFAECSAAWLPSWLSRLQGQADYMANALPKLERTPLEYAQDGRIFCGIELYEGAAMARSVIELVGDGVLMFSSDYPHNQCEFPRSPDIVLGWEGISPDAMGKLMGGNAERFLRM